MLTVDANVFVSASAPAEVFHVDSDSFLSRIGQASVPLLCPALVLPETASGVMRPTGNALAAQLAVASIKAFPSLTLFTLTEQRAGQAAQIAITCRLRGADAVYAAMALEFGTTLITWDTELRTRGALAVPTMTPGEWLAANPAI